MQAATVLTSNMVSTATAADRPRTAQLSAVPWTRTRLAAAAAGPDALLALIADVVIGVIGMSAVSIRNLDDRVKDRLRVRAARHGRSMEAEMRAILTDAVSEGGEEEGFLQAILDRFGQLGGVDLDIPERTARPRAAEFG